MDSHVFHKWGGGIAPDFPRIVDAEREFLHTADGDRLIDAAAGAAVVREPIASASDARYGGTFGHGHTYFGLPPSAAVALEVIEQYTVEVFRAGRVAGERLGEALEPLEGESIVGDLRRCGLLAGIEFVADSASKEPFDPDLDVAERARAGGRRVRLPRRR